MPGSRFVTAIFLLMASCALLISSNTVAVAQERGSETLDDLRAATWSTLPVTEADRVKEEAHEYAITSWQPQADGEAVARIVSRPSTTRFEKGDPKESCGGMQAHPAQGGTEEGGVMERALFGADRHVRLSNPSSKEWNQTVATDENGNLYVAWQDDFLSKDYIQIYWSDDGGILWKAYGYITDTGADLREPSLAVGMGSHDKLFIAYIVDDGVNMAVPEVAVADLGSPSFSFASVPVWNWEGYSKPVIWTDAWDFWNYNAYLTCEAAVDSAAGNINVGAWRSIDFGATWGNQAVVMGNYDSNAWIDPDGSYGTTENRVHIVAYNDTTNMISLVESTTFGTSYTAEQALISIGTEPSHAVDPEIAAALYHDHVMICCTRSYDGHDTIGQMYSTDAGTTWSTLYVLNGYPATPAFGPALQANEGGQSWHLTFTCDHLAYYSQRPQDLSDLWQATPDIVSDTTFASHDYPVKGITSNWDTDVPGIAWADYRDAAGDYDTYFDFKGNLYIRYVPSEFAKIQDAIDAGPNGVEVHVSHGTYKENIDFHGKSAFVFALEGADRTVIDGNSAGSVLTFRNGEDGKSLVQGFTLTNGNYGAGGCVYCDGTTPQIINCLMIGNVGSNGGVLFCYNAGPILTHVTISLNLASVAGGAAYLKGTSNPEIRNSILWNDDAPSGPEIYVESGSPAVVYCNVQGGWPGTGNINKDPLFYDATGDFHIKYTSACRSAASGSLPGLPLIDFEGDPRTGTKLDMGADEFDRHLYYKGNATPGGSIYFGLVGQPSSNQVGLFLSAFVLPSPLHYVYGDLWLGAPILGPYILGTIPSTGIMALPTTVPATPPGPYNLYLQALIGPPLKLTNLCTLYVH